MDPRRLSPGEWVAGACGVALIVALFLPWYSANGHSVTAWQSMAVDDVILFISGLLAIVAGIVVAVRRFAGISVATTSLAILPAAIGLIVTVYRVISPAPPHGVSLEIGAWLALAATLGIAVGSWRGATDEGPARRNPARGRRVAEEALREAELLPLSGAPQK